MTQLLPSAFKRCRRIQDAGWLWSGGFALDTPGDIFVNIRHRSDSLPHALKS